MQQPTLLVMFGLFLFGCGDGTLVVQDDSDEEPAHNAATTTVDDHQTTTAPGPSQDPTDPVNDPISDTNNGTAAATNNATTANNTNGMTVPPTNNMTPGPAFHPMYVAVADFMREKCVNCHNQGQNGNIVVPSADVSNAELRVNLEGVVATTGRLLIEPNDPAESQVYIMITNSAGEQFPPETIAIVEDWINVGAPYEP